MILPPIRPRHQSTYLAESRRFALRLNWRQKRGPRFQREFCNYFFRYLSILLVLVAATSEASSVLWHGGSSISASDLNTAANWNGGVIPINGDAFFDTTAANFNPTLNSPSPENPISSLTFFSMTITSTADVRFAFNIGNGSSLSLIGLGVNQSSSGTISHFQFNPGSSLTFAPDSNSTNGNGVVSYRFDNASLNFQGASQGVTSSVVLNNNSSLNLMGTNSSISLGEINTDATANAIHLGDSNTLVLGTTGSNSTIIAAIDDSGPTGSIISLEAGISTLAGQNSYRGGTLLNEATLIVQNDANLGNPAAPLTFSGGTLLIVQPNVDSPFTSSRTFIIDGEKNAFINIPGNTNPILDGPIVGKSSEIWEKIGTGTLTLTGDSSAYEGKTRISEGTLSVNGKLGGNVEVTNGSLLRGIGILTGNATVLGAATVAPGNSIGTLTVNGDYTQQQPSKLLIEFDQNEASLLKVGGVATLQGGTVILENKGTLDVGKTFPILQAASGINGTFESVTSQDSENALYIPSLIYDAYDVYFAIKPNLSNAAHTENQKTVAAIIDAISDPTPSQTIFLNALVSLNPLKGKHALNQLSGQQHSSDLLLTELINRQFLRRMYDPLRMILNKYPCYEEWYDREKECCLPYQVDTWFSASGSRISQKGGNNSIGFKMEGPQVTMGAQKRFPHRITAGAAFSYEYDFVHYYLGGRGKMSSFLGGLYALYRPAHYYVLLEAAYGYTINSMKRPIEMGSITYSARCTPKMQQVTGYAEYGIDIAYEDILIQPFVGFEGGAYWRHGITEKGAKDLNLTIKKRKRGEANSRLGAHFYSGLLPTKFDVALDLAWIHRWTERSNKIHEHFATFGPECTIEGVPLYLNSFEFSLAISKEICPNMDFFAEFDGEFWKRSFSYYGLGGVEWRW